MNYCTSKIRSFTVFANVPKKPKDIKKFKNKGRLWNQKMNSFQNWLFFGISTGQNTTLSLL